jgi:DNA-binding transcriptional LysR family regulator
MDYDLRLLQYAVALAEHRNFARAAKALHVTQPTLSRGIHSLEVICGSRLFDRTSRGADPTDAGFLFLKHASEVLARAGDLAREMNLVAGFETGDLRIGSATYPTHMYVDRALCRLIREHPSVQINVAVDNWANIVPMLRNREIDLAIMDVTASESDPEIEVSKLAQYQGYMVFRSGHPLLQLRGKERSKLAWNFPIVFTSRFPSDMFRGLAEALCASRKINRPELAGKAVVSIACESLPMMKTIAMETDAIAILPLRLVFEEVKAGELTAVPGPAWLKGNFGIARIAHRSLSPIAEEFVRIVREEDAALLAWEKQATQELFGRKVEARKSLVNRRTLGFHPDS